MSKVRLNKFKNGYYEIEPGSSKQRKEHYKFKLLKKKNKKFNKQSDYRKMANKKK